MHLLNSGHTEFGGYQIVACLIPERKLHRGRTKAVAQGSAWPTRLAGLQNTPQRPLVDPAHSQAVHVHRAAVSPVEGVQEPRTR